MTTNSIKNPEINYLYLLLIQGRQRALEHLALFVSASDPLRDGLFEAIFLV